MQYPSCSPTQGFSVLRFLGILIELAGLPSPLLSSNVMPKKLEWSPCRRDEDGTFTLSLVSRFL